MKIKSLKTISTILFSLTILACGNNKDLNALEEIEVFKGIKLNSNIESAPFYKDLKISTKEEDIRIKDELLSKYQYDKLFDKYRVDYLDISTFEGKIWVLNVKLEIPYNGNDNDIFKDLFVKKYGKPDSLYNNNWCYLWNKQNYSIEIYPLSERSSITEYGDTTNAPPREVTEWIINYKSKDLYELRKSVRDSIKNQKEKKDLKEI